MAPVAAEVCRSQAGVGGVAVKKCRETETEPGVAVGETAEDPQVTQDQDVAPDETLHGFL